MEVRMGRGFCLVMLVMAVCGFGAIVTTVDPQVPDMRQWTTAEWRPFIAAVCFGVIAVGNFVGLIRED